MIPINRIHHISVICSDYEKSKTFYTEIVGLKISGEIYREARQSWKADLTLHGIYVVELFSFPAPPSRITQPEATGLRHLAFEVNNIDESIAALKESTTRFEPIRTDELTGKRFTFIFDPDNLPIELYEK